MGLTKAELQRLAEKQEAKAERTFQLYQETGIARYDRERRNAEDLADALFAAADAIEEHMALVNIRAEYAWQAGQADAALAENAPREKLVKILESIISYAAATCHYARRERPSEKGGA